MNEVGTKRVKNPPVSNLPHDIVKQHILSYSVESCFPEGIVAPEGIIAKFRL